MEAKTQCFAAFPPGNDASLPHFLHLCYLVPDRRGLLKLQVLGVFPHLPLQGADKLYQLGGDKHILGLLQDLPGGGGKICLSEQSIAGEDERPGGRVYLLKDKSGKLWPYPAV